MVSTGRFQCMLFINNSRYLSEDKSKGVHRFTRPQEYNVSFVQFSSSDSASELKDCWMIAVRAIRNIDIREEVHTDYVPEYCFPEL